MQNITSILGQNYHFTHAWELSSAGNLRRELRKLRTSSLDLRDVGRDFGFSLCAAPLSDSCPKILEWGDRRLEIRVKIRVDLGVEIRGRIIKVRTYSIFKLSYLHDMSEVFMLSIGINKKINQKTRNKQNP